MAYQKNIWQNGDIITAQKMNNIEEGIENNGVVFVNFVSTSNPETFTIECTANNLIEYIRSGKNVRAVAKSTNEVISFMSFDIIYAHEMPQQGYIFCAFVPFRPNSTISMFVSSDGDSYPELLTQQGN